MNHQDPSVFQCDVKDPVQAIIGRVLWMIVGPILLAVTTVLIIVTDTGWLTIYDAAYYTALALMLGGRWMEIRTGYGRTLQAAFATTEHFRRYAVRLVLWGFFAWVTANLIGNHVLPMLL